MPNVSVLLPARNEAAYIASALNDLQRQTLANIEIVVIDDGSTDVTAGIVEAMAKQDRRIRLMRNPATGIVSALNHGLEQARGEYVARMDADDGCAPTRLAEQLALLQSRPEISLASCLIVPPPGETYAGGYAAYAEWVNSLIEPDAIERERFIECPIVHPTLMMETKLLREMGGWRDGEFPEDYDLVLRLAAAGKRMAKVAAALYFWRDRPQRLSRVDSRYAPEAFAALKAQYLADGPLCERNEIVVWGAGKVGRRLVKPLLATGRKVVAWIDIDVKKIGHMRGGAPVYAPSKLLELRGYPLLIYVGSRGARELIRPQLAQYGFTEGENVWFCA